MPEEAIRPLTSTSGHNPDHDSATLFQLAETQRVKFPNSIDVRDYCGALPVSRTVFCHASGFTATSLVSS